MEAFRELSEVLLLSGLKYVVFNGTRKSGALCLAIVPNLWKCGLQHQKSETRELKFEFGHQRSIPKT